MDCFRVPLKNFWRPVWVGIEGVFDVALSILLFGESFRLNCLLNYAYILAFESYLEQIETETGSKLAMM